MTTTPAAPASAAERHIATEHGPGKPRWRNLAGGQSIGLIAALILVLALFGSLNPDYLSWQNIQVIGEAVTISGLLAVMQTVVIICGALDISVGSQAGLYSVVSAMVFTSAGSSALLGMAAAIGLGAVVGLLNGAIIIYGRVNAVIATLAGLAAYQGVAELVSNGSAQGYVLNDSVFVFLARGQIIGLPTMVWLLILAAAAIHILLKYTDIGRNIYAIGGNDTAARLAGINLNKYIIAVFALSGVVAALAGILITARTGSGEPVSGSQGLELQAITAAALGGCALKGGKGGVGGTLLAVALLGALSNGLTVQGVNSFWQNIAQGALLVVAVVIQQRGSTGRSVGLPA